MIDFLKGYIAHRDSEYVVLDVKGVGYRVFVTNPYAPFPADQETVLYIHYHVREDAHHLFGFTTREEQTLFRRLLDVSGIGPRVALGILAGGRPEAVIGAIQQENLAFLTKLPGIGRKTAQRMILDLKDKLQGLPASYTEVATAVDLFSQTPPVSGLSNWKEAKEALKALGYTEAETEKAWTAISGKVKDNETVDSLMKQALQALFKG